MSDAIQLHSVAVGTPQVIGQRLGKEVLSGIRKTVVQNSTVTVGQTNIAGDGQADLISHGGIDKAVYCYPRAHREAWLSELGYGDADAAFGENLSVSGVTEADVRIGDRWQWGDVVLEVSQPRWPCYKLAMMSGHPELVKLLPQTGRCGWYLRVLTPGEAPTSGDIAVIHRDPETVSVAMALRARLKHLDRVTMDRVLAHPKLANAWRSK